MKFKGHGIVWDAEKNCILCKFENGEFETEDSRTIEILTSGDYESEKSKAIGKTTDFNSKTVEDLKSLLDEKGISYDAKLKKAELVEILASSDIKGAE